MSLDTLAQEVRWVAWRNEPRGKKYSKVPYAPNGRRAKSDYPTTWGTRAEAEAIAGRLVNGQGGGLAPWAAAILDLVPTYAEVSPSRRGLKLFFYVASEDFRPFLDRIGAPPHQWGVRRDVPGEDARDHGPAIEVYFSHRYFTVTRMQWATAPNRLIMLDCDALERLATLIPPARLGADRRGNGSADNSRSAIAFRKGAALRREGKTFEQMCEALRVDTETAGWVREKGDANDGRELHRIWEKAQASIGTSAPKRKHALGGGLATPGAPRQLDIGSDIEIAECVANDLRRDFGEIVFADGDFWLYEGTHWQPIDDPTARRTVHLYDGAIYRGASGKPSIVRLSKSRIDSVLHEMGAMLARPDFFANAAVGIKCASGFIVFDPTDRPSKESGGAAHGSRPAPLVR